MPAKKPVQGDLFDGWDDVAPVEGEDTYGETLRLELGEIFVGHYVRSEEGIETDNGTATAHRFANPDGDAVTIWGSKDLNSKLNAVAAGDLVRIEFQKEIEMKSGKNPLKLYKVQSRKG